MSDGWRYSMRQVLAILLCFMLFSAFDWAFKRKVSSPKPSKATVLEYKKEIASGSTELSSKRAKAVTDGAINPEVPAATTPVLGSGTPEEIQASAEGLKRLSMTLQKKES